MGFVSSSSCGFSDRCIYANKECLSLRAAGMQRGPPSTGLGRHSRSQQLPERTVSVSTRQLPHGLCAGVQWQMK